jgi:hypothetical protein
MRLYTTQIEAGSEVARQRAAEQLQEFGHVLLTGVYDAELGVTAHDEIMHEPGMFPRPHVSNFDRDGYSLVREATTRHGLALDQGTPALRQLRAAINEQAELLGQSLFPTEPKREVVDELIESRHTQPDGIPSVITAPWWRLVREEQGPLVAIAGLEGESDLGIESNADSGERGYYHLTPGSVAIFAATRRVADGDLPRRFGQKPSHLESPATYVSYLMTAQPKFQGF